MTTLKHDVRLGIQALRLEGYLVNDELEAKNWAAVTVPFPQTPPSVQLRDDELVIQVRLSSSGRFFSFYSPLAIINNPVSASACEHILRRQFYADQVGSASLAIMNVNDTDALAVIIHWSLDKIYPEDFTALFYSFMQAIFTLIPEVAALIRQGQSLYPLHTSIQAG